MFQNHSSKNKTITIHVKKKKKMFDLCDLTTDTCLSANDTLIISHS